MLLLLVLFTGNDRNNRVSCSHYLFFSALFDPIEILAENNAEYYLRKRIRVAPTHIFVLQVVIYTHTHTHKNFNFSLVHASVCDTAFLVV
jgi:hypothetical protein